MLGFAFNKPAVAFDVYFQLGDYLRLIPHKIILTTALFEHELDASYETKFVLGGGLELVINDRYSLEFSIYFVPGKIMPTDVEYKRPIDHIDAILSFGFGVKL
ncbi:MAG: hypothetical protein C4617_04000 [Candidatus Liberibacter europaeus]|uniref:Outer membrane protein beta-barrel domain-containing protein n=1 Tax=Candidatus Liberibacter europaeus TaxID=744859 RepID=A0A2T4VX73_9HYPH|nr:hypothetical protein [Candidatus Liberibacter europaeus]PTL86372.1 MAG: hypothetical protein C4617_04000 [Candidatus Liberibacter europaeus]